MKCYYCENEATIIKKIKNKNGNEFQLPLCEEHCNLEIKSTTLNTEKTKPNEVVEKSSSEVDNKEEQQDNPLMKIKDIFGACMVVAFFVAFIGLITGFAGMYEYDEALKMYIGFTLLFAGVIYGLKCYILRLLCDVPDYYISKFKK